jgi:hypothetical protein
LEEPTPWRSRVSVVAPSQPYLRIGSGGPLVRAVQNQLHDRGFLTDAPDGIFGVETERAVRAFQSGRKLDPDGIIGPETWKNLIESGLDPAALPEARAPRSHPPHPFLRIGSWGKHVAAIQAVLDVKASSVFDVRTEEAVRALQERAGLPPDGIVGRATWTALVRSGLDPLELPPFGHEEPLETSDAVRNVHASHAADELTAHEFAAELLRVHPEYADGRAASFDVGKGPAAAPSVFVLEWLGRVRPLFDASRVPRLTTRTVVWGLALLDRHLRIRLETDGFLTAFRAFRTEEILSPEGRYLLESQAGVQPEPRIASDVWTVEDTLDYSEYADAIASFLRNDDTVPPLTIGIKAPWGAGKTSLMRMIQQRLDPRDNSETWEPKKIGLENATKLERQGGIRIVDLLRRIIRPRGVALNLDKLGVKAPEDVEASWWRPTVWFNPWMYQSSEQVWAGLAQEIIGQVTERMPRVDRERFWLELNISRFDESAVRRRIYAALFERLVPVALLVTLLLAAGITVLVVPALSEMTRWLFGAAGLTFLTGVLIQGRRLLFDSASESLGSLVTGPALHDAAGNVVRGGRGSLGDLVVDPGYESRLGFLYLVQTDMPRVLRIVATPERPLVVFVDDLDRCSPGTVAQVIEAVNLFLAGQFPNCIFVLALEPAVVAAHVEAANRELVQVLKAGGLSGDWSTLGWRFLEKIVQLPLSLPARSDESQWQAYTTSLLTREEKGSTAPLQREVPRPTAPPDVPAEAAPPPTSPRTFRRRKPKPVPPSPAPEGETERLKLVTRIETAIRSRHPTVESIPRAAREAQGEVLGETRDGLSPETIEAANRVFVDLYSDAAASAAIAHGVGYLPTKTPREIKRYVNLFRFYTFIVQQRRFHAPWEADSDDDHDPPPDANAVAKLAALAIRWPQLLDALARRPAGGPTVLALLEDAARTSEGWSEALALLGVARDPDGTQPAAWIGELKPFLEAGPTIAPTARALL